MDKFNFISDDLFRHNLENDYLELEKCLSNKSYKSVLILSGSIIEAILIDYLISLDLNGLTKSKLLKWDLNNAIKKCFELNIISEKSKNLSDVVRNYRNLIHPGRTVRTKIILDENDAIVAKSLVEIIIKEVGEKKQESYGFTAEQILSKIEKDTTSEVIWHHLIKKVNINEKMRLLIKNIPERYFKIYNESDFSEYYPEEELNNLSKFFKSVYNSTPEDIKKESAEKFLDIVIEGSGLEVRTYLEAFFIIEYLKYYSPENKQLVKEHLFGFIKAGINKDISESLKGISQFLNKNESNEIVSILVDRVTNSNDKYEISSAKILLYNEYQNGDEYIQKYVLSYIDEAIELYDFSESLVKRYKNLRDYLTGEDLPF